MAPVLLAPPPPRLLLLLLVPLLLLRPPPPPLLLLPRLLLESNMPLSCHTEYAGAKLNLTAVVGCNFLFILAASVCEPCKTFERTPTNNWRLQIPDGRK